MKIRKYKLTYQIFNFFLKNQLLHNVPLFKKYGLKKKYFSPLSSEDFRGLKSELNIHDAEDSRLEMPKNKKFQYIDTRFKEPLLSWSKNGYAVLENFFSEEEIEACNQDIEKLINENTVKFRYSNKIMFAFHHSQIIEKMGNQKKLLDILNLIMGKEVELFQSINFLEGSQQRAHSDSIHMTTFPYGNLIAIWIALEDITLDCGPLHYYPGSHKLDYVMNRDYNNIGTKYKLGKKNYTDYENHIETVIKKNNLKKEVFIAKKGDVLIWHANLLHGGEKVLNEKSTRKSMVFHYYAKDSICFHEITQRPTLKKKSKKQI